MDEIDQAFKHYPRKLFLPQAALAHASEDAPISIGFGQTNSQPSTVKRMLQWLRVEPGQKVLDVGSGSGWTTALLAHLVGKDGMVFAVEKISELLDFGRQNCRQAGVDNAQFYQAGDQLGLPEQAPFDRILVNAAATMLPKELIEQLHDQGRMVAPVLNSVFIVDKTSDGVTYNEHPGYMFVPLVQ